jgi:DNA-directed RNA polymerase I subunit RPA1
MVSADPKNAIIRKQVSSVTFGFYTDDDVRARAVVEITSPQAFDALGTPLPRGLYDPHMGPFDSNHKSAATCITCACPYSTCPGHAGVVELCVPVYHPILFPFLVQLLRTKCLACHKFRIATLPMQIVKCKYTLLSQGRLQDALELDMKLAQHQQQQRQDDDDAQTRSTNAIPKPLRSSAAVEALLLELIQEWNTTSASNANGSTSPESTETSYEREFKRQLRKEFLSACLTAKKCPHCGAFSPKIRQDESNKIFQSKLAATNARINAAEGIVLRPALGNDDTADNNSHDDNDDDGDNASSDDDEKKDSNNTPLRDKFMHALEVEAQVRRTWQTDPVLCHYIFGGPTTTTTTTANGSNHGEEGDGYRVFFLRAIPVPPSRFRPPMMMGSMTVENSQNMYLNQLLVSNDKIRTLLSSTATTKSAEDQAAAFTTWIDLQTTINIHFDSSKDPKAGASNNNGIRQILERRRASFENT